MTVLEIPAGILQALASGTLERFAIGGVELVASPKDWSAYWPQARP